MNRYKVLTTVQIGIGCHYERGARACLFLKVASPASPDQQWAASASWGPAWVQPSWDGPSPWPGGLSRCIAAACFPHVPSPTTRTVLPLGHWEWIIWKKWLPVPFQSLSCFHLQPDGLSGRVSAKTVCFTAVRRHWHWIEKALKMAINHLIYVGSDLYWYGSSYHLKWFVFHFTLYMRVITVHTTYNRHGYYGQLVIVDKNWFPKPNILNPIHFS